MANQKAPSIPWARVVLIALTLGGALMMWAGLSSIFQGNLSGWVISSMILGLVILVLGLVYLAIFTLKRLHYGAIVTLATVSALAAFGPPLEGFDWWLYISAGLIFILGALVAQRVIRDEIANRLTPRLRRTMGASLTRILLPLILMWSVLFYIFPPASVSALFYKFAIPRPVFDAIVNPVVNMIEKPDERKTAQGLIKFASQWGLSIDQALLDYVTGAAAVEGDAIKFNVSDALYNKFNQNVRQFLMPYQNEALVVLSFGLLAALHAAVVPFRYAVIWLGILIFGLLKRLGIIEQRVRSVEQLHYELKDDHE